MVVNAHMVDIIMLDSNNNEISKLSAYIDDLPIGGFVEISTSINRDLANAYDYKLVIK